MGRLVQNLKVRYIEWDKKKVHILEWNTLESMLLLYGQIPYRYIAFH